MNTCMETTTILFFSLHSLHNVTSRLLLTLTVQWCMFFSAYCAGMWLAALRMQVEMADVLGMCEDKERFSAILDRGKKSFEEKLWNGEDCGFMCV